MQKVRRLCLKIGFTPTDFSHAIQNHQYTMSISCFPWHGPWIWGKSTISSYISYISSYLMALSNV
jgi:hypothetical protein